MGWRTDKRRRTGERGKGEWVKGARLKTGEWFESPERTNESSPAPIRIGTGNAIE